MKLKDVLNQLQAGLPKLLLLLALLVTQHLHPIMNLKVHQGLVVAHDSQYLNCQYFEQLILDICEDGL